MTRVLKVRGGEAGSVQSLRSPWGPGMAAPGAPAPLPDPEVVALREEQAQLRHQLETARTDLADLRRQAGDAFGKGEAEGRAAGRHEAEDTSAKALALLEGGVGRAVAEVARALESLERLAPELARQALAGVLGETDDRAGLVAAIVRRQLKTLETQAILHISVSTADFGDGTALSDLSRSLGANQVDLRVDGALKSGDCRIRLRLGTLDVGLDQQWGRLSALLDEMSRPEGKA